MSSFLNESSGRVEKLLWTFIVLVLFAMVATLFAQCSGERGQSVGRKEVRVDTLWRTEAPQIIRDTVVREVYKVRYKYSYGDTIRTTEVLTVADSVLLSQYDSLARILDSQKISYILSLDTVTQYKDTVSIDCFPIASVLTYHFRPAPRPVEIVTENNVVEETSWWTLIGTAISAFAAGYVAQEVIK